MEGKRVAKRQIINRATDCMDIEFMHNRRELRRRSSKGRKEKKQSALLKLAEDGCAGSKCNKIYGISSISSDNPACYLREGCEQEHVSRLRAKHSSCDCSCVSPNSTIMTEQERWRVAMAIKGRILRRG